jgi:hypothetical protein
MGFGNRALCPRPAPSPPPSAVCRQRLRPSARCRAAPCRTLPEPVTRSCRYRILTRRIIQSRLNRQITAHNDSAQRQAALTMQQRAPSSALGLWDLPGELQECIVAAVVAPPSALHLRFESWRDAVGLALTCRAGRDAVLAEARRKLARPGDGWAAGAVGSEPPLLSKQQVAAAPFEQLRAWADAAGIKRLPGFTLTIAQLRAVVTTKCCSTLPLWARLMCDGARVSWQGRLVASHYHAPQLRLLHVLQARCMRCAVPPRPSPPRCLPRPALPPAQPVAAAALHMDNGATVSLTAARTAWRLSEVREPRRGGMAGEGGGATRPALRGAAHSSTAAPCTCAPRRSAAARTRRQSGCQAHNGHPAARARSCACMPLLAHGRSHRPTGRRRRCCRSKSTPPGVASTCG